MKEYRTIREVSGPLMVVDQVEGVTYDELGEIQLHDGTIRRCKVLEVDGDRAVVQLFENMPGFLDFFRNRPVDEIEINIV